MSIFGHAPDHNPLMPVVEATCHDHFMEAAHAFSLHTQHMALHDIRMDMMHFGAAADDAIIERTCIDERYADYPEVRAMLLARAQAHYRRFGLDSIFIDPNLPAPVITCPTIRHQPKRQAPLLLQALNHFGARLLGTI